MTNYHPEYKPGCKLANARIAELEAENERLNYIVNGLSIKWPGTTASWEAAYHDIRSRWTGRIAT